MDYLKDFLKKHAIISILLSGFFNNPLYAQENNAYLTAPVAFYKEKKIILLQDKDPVKQYLNRVLQENNLSEQFNFTATDTKSLSDYKLEVDYAVGCGSMKPVKNCRIAFLWNLFRYDNAPVAGWRADYPIKVTEGQAASRFVDTKIPKEILQQSGHDLLQSLSDIYISQVTTKKPVFFSGDFVKACPHFDMNGFLSAYSLQLAKDNKASLKWYTRFMVTSLKSHHNHIKISHFLENSQGKKANISQELIVEDTKSFACEDSLKAVMPKIKPFLR